MAEVKTVATASQPSATVYGLRLASLGLDIRWTATNRGTLTRIGGDPTRMHLGTASSRPGTIAATAELVTPARTGPLRRRRRTAGRCRGVRSHRNRGGDGRHNGVSSPTQATVPTADQPLWVAIRNRTRAIAFNGSGYKDFMDRVLCQDPRTNTNAALKRQATELRSDIYGVAAYELLKTATEVFLLLNCGVAIDTTLPKTPTCSTRTRKRAGSDRTCP